MALFATSLGEDGAQLRPLEPWNARELLEHIERGRAYVGRYTPLAATVNDLASSRAFLARFADRTRDDRARIAGIWLNDRLVGGVVLRAMNLQEGFAEAGCWLEPEVVGRGLVTRAAGVLIDWAVQERGIHRIEWWVRSDNTESLAVARRLGMRRDGVLRERIVKDGRRHDVEIWSVLAPEWRARGGAPDTGADADPDTDPDVRAGPEPDPRSGPQVPQ